MNPNIEFITYTWDEQRVTVTPVYDIHDEPVYDNNDLIECDIAFSLLPPGIASEKGDQNRLTAHELTTLIVECQRFAGQDVRTLLSQSTSAWSEIGKAAILRESALKQLATNAFWLGFFDTAIAIRDVYRLCEDKLGKYDPDEMTATLDWAETISSAFSNTVKNHESEQWTKPVFLTIGWDNEEMYTVAVNWLTVMQGTETRHKTQRIAQGVYLLLALYPTAVFAYLDDAQETWKAFGANHGLDLVIKTTSDEAHRYQLEGKDAIANQLMKAVDAYKRQRKQATAAIAKAKPDEDTELLIEALDLITR